MPGIEGFFGPLKYYRLHSLHPTQVSQGMVEKFARSVGDGWATQGQGAHYKQKVQPSRPDQVWAQSSNIINTKAFPPAKAIIDF